MATNRRGGIPTPGLDIAGSRLAGLGVGPVEEWLYRILLRYGPATLGELTTRAAGTVSVGQLRRLVPRLVDLGLVSRLPGRPIRLVPAPPEAAIDALAARRLEELNRGRAATTELLEEASFGANSRPEQLVELITGQEAVARRFVHPLETAQEEMRAFVLPPYALDPADPDHPQKSAPVKPGLRIRGIYDPVALQSPAMLARVAGYVARGEDARIGEVPLKLILADHRTALLPLTYGGAINSALVIHASALLDALVSLFEVLWRAAVPFPVANGRGGDGRGGDGRGGDDNAARETQVLALLVAGVSDDAIARRLGVSSRTVQRDIRKICDDLGAVTRFQAGFKGGIASARHPGGLRPPEESSSPSAAP